MEKIKSFVAKDQRLAFILSSLMLGVVLAGISFLFRIDLVAATESQAALVLKINTSSAKALVAIEYRFGDISDLFHLYPVNEKDAIIELGFPVFEYFDARNTTIRIGDIRKLRKG